jgi:3-oxoacyl-(acyl-carrier-protein) synthase/3-hydroxymyristoyl/3-hydroxydecanoyl-(acyl carrier protein) dehydratase
MKFEPIAIVGQGCILPGGLSPEDLWVTILEGRDVLDAPPADYWGVSPANVLQSKTSATHFDHTWSDRGGYVRGFDRVFEPDGFMMEASALAGLDPLYQWAMQAARQAIESAGWRPGHVPGRAGVMLGNLSYPTRKMADLAGAVWRGQTDGLDWRNRFTSGLPAHLVARALGLSGGAVALDAACASSLYAIKLACDRLHDGTADVMLAGGVNRADDLFLHVGFCALQAMSRTGRSRPFHVGADGLVPAEGAGFVVLKRLGDALHSGDKILGIIRAVGLSNDGRGRSLLTPSQEGQERAMRLAYEMAGLEPEDISLIECHATGTPLGDLTELKSMARIFADQRDVPIGSLKSNLGHPITASGVAGLIKVLAAMRAGIRPPTLHVEDPAPFLATSPFRLLKEAEPWVCDGPRRAAINNFGFGGNNAHLLVEEWVEPVANERSRPWWLIGKPEATDDVAIVGLSLMVGDYETRDVAESFVVEGRPLTRVEDDGIRRARMSLIQLDLAQVRFPPNDLKQALPQQLAALKAALNIAELLRSLPADRTSVLMGMGCDAEIARWGVRWRLADEVQDQDQLKQAREGVVQGLVAASVVGTMPNIVANRLNSQFDLRGPSFTISREQLSGTTALSMAARALRHREIDAAVVGAVDMSCEPVHEAAARALLTAGEQTPGDAAVILVLKRAADARRDGDTIYAFLPSAEVEAEETLTLGNAPGAHNVADGLGHAHAASGLLHVATGALYGFLGVTPGGQPWSQGDRAVMVSMEGLGGEHEQIALIPPHNGHPSANAQLGRLNVASFTARPDSKHAKLLAFPAHMPSVKLPAVSAKRETPSEVSNSLHSSLAPLSTLEPKKPATMTHRPDTHRLAAPPALPAASDQLAPLGAALVIDAPQPLFVARAAQPAPALQAASIATPALESADHAVLVSPDGAYIDMAERLSAFASAHQVFLAQQAEVQAKFLAGQQAMHRAFLQAAFNAPASSQVPQRTPPSPVFALPVADQITPPAVFAPSVAAQLTPSPVLTENPSTLKTPPPVVTSPPVSQETPPAVPPARVRHEARANGGHRANQPVRPADKKVPTPTKKRTPTGLTLDKEGLRIHASGKISEIYGPEFAIQDDYRRQTRMPEPPLLLADRLLGIDAPKAQIGTGSLWTETDVKPDSWWLHQGRMPVGIMIESGQADLMLISWMGADFANKGDRVYRLLGCELTFLGGLPEVGDTLRYDIHVHGHARQGDIRMFFFHYDCSINGVERLSVRNGQAGFFTDEELANSGGILWKPEDEQVSGPMDKTLARTQRTSLSRADLEALAAGQIWQTFGRGFERAASHTRTPVISGGDMLFMDEVTHLDFEGGPWGRGYLRAVQYIKPNTWFFSGHFKNDPCMPGTLMYEGTLQTMALYMTALGMTLECDGWRFEPVPFETYKLVCRGQVTPAARELVYEVFVREVIAGPEPTLFADLLCTVDGLGAFHCARMGLKLSPGWPMDEGIPELEGYVEPKPVAEWKGFKFDYKSLLACAWGKPSTAFGPMYERFDTHRKVARLPGPPYHFLSRITDVQGEMGVMKPGAKLIAEYDVPPDAWYFRENGAPTMPCAVLMEAGLQPCGWLASYIGCALSVDIDMFFRNLDGTGTQHMEVTPSTGTLRTEVLLKSVAKAGGTIIVSFAVKMFAGAQPVYTMDTVFGFFPGPALAQQAGLDTTQAQRELLAAPCDAPVIDLTTRPARFVGGAGARLAEPMLLMIDRVTGRWPTAGKAGLGQWRAVKDVDPAEWFFKAHFFQDPVQPGSLGIEAMINLLQFAMLDLGLDEEIGPDAHFEPVAIGGAMTWSYRGQVLPKNKLISSQVEITRIEREADGILAVAEASLWVDGMRIYRASNLGMRIKRGPAEKKKFLVVSAAQTAADVVTSAALMHGSSATADRPGVVELELDPARDTWLADHCPTYTRPALPMMSVLDLLGQAASVGAGGAQVVEVSDLKVTRWVIVDGPRKLRAVATPAGPNVWEARLDVWWEAPNQAMSRWETHATGQVVTAPGGVTGPVEAPSPLKGAQPLPNPYLSGALFHGPAFHVLMDGALIGSNGAAGALEVERCRVPTGLLQPGLLDGALHIVPHEGLDVWTSERLDAQRVAYPHRVVWARFAGPAPMSGIAAVDARFVGFEDVQGRFPVVDLWLSAGGRPWAQIRLVEVLMPKGPLGSPSGLVRRAFLAQRRAVPGLLLSDEVGAGAVRLDAQRVAESSWFKGTLESVYGTSGKGEALVGEIALKEAVSLAAHGAIHPSQVVVHGEDVSCPALPLERIAVQATREGDSVTARATLEVDWWPVRSWWLARLGMEQGWFGDLLYWALLKRYARHVIVQAPAAMAAIRGRSVLLLGNHQVQLESLLVTALGSWLTDTTVVTMANAKHKERWVGKLVHGVFGHPGCDDPRNIVYFDPSQPERMPALIAGFKEDVARRGASIMVHAPGTRQTSAGQRVEKVTSMLLDMAAELGMPIVPVHFAGGLPIEPLTHKLEVPYGHTAQDYIFGAPIMPQELAALPYAQRRQRVLSAINALAPVYDAPHAPNVAVAKRIEALAPEAPPLVAIWAALKDALDGLGVPVEQAQAQLAQISGESS